MKIDYTHNNFFRCGWGDKNTFNFKNKKDLDYWVTYDCAKQMPGTFREECVRAAKLIGEQSKKPILIFFSGGIDSEITVRSFMDANVDFTVCIVNLYYDNILSNTHDTNFAFSFVKQHNLSVKEIDYNFSNFMNERYIDGVYTYQTWLPGSIIHAELVSMLCKDYLCVFGLGDILLKRARHNGYPDVDGISVISDPKSVTAIHAGALMAEPVIAEFLAYTPEQMLSWMLHPDIQTFIKYERAFPILDIYNLKPFIYFKMWPDMAVRPKYSGLEGIHRLSKKEIWMNDPVFKEGMNITSQMNVKVHISSSELISMLLPR
jgi:hypothetical protein